MDLVVKLLGIGELQLVLHVGVVADTWKRESVIAPASSILQEPDKALHPSMIISMPEERVLNPQNHASLGSPRQEIYSPFVLVECSVTLIS